MSSKIACPIKKKKKEYLFDDFIVFNSFCFSWSIPLISVWTLENNFRTQNSKSSHDNSSD